MPAAIHWEPVSEPHLPVRVLRDTMDCRVEIVALLAMTESVVIARALRNARGDPLALAKRTDKAVHQRCI